MRRILAFPIVALVALVAASVSNAGREQQTLTCAGLGTITVTVTTTTNDHSVAWGVGTVSLVEAPRHSRQLLGDDHRPDDEQGAGLVLPGQRQGSGMHNQPTITCTAPPETATAGELGIPGINPNDVIEFDLSGPGRPQAVDLQYRRRGNFDSPPPLLETRITRLPTHAFDVRPYLGEAGESRIWRVSTTRRSCAPRHRQRCQSTKPRPRRGTRRSRHSRIWRRRRGP
jgi:hypothetical protein